MEADAQGNDDICYLQPTGIGASPAQYHAEKIVALRVAEVSKGSYLVTYHLYDVPTGEMIASQKKECAQCSFEKLKALCKNLPAT